jgi:hypothetical protein
MASLHELMAAAVSGAHSVPVYGWMREECEGAALLGLARYKPETTGHAFRRGRLDALAEFSKLTGGRVRRKLHKVSWADGMDTPNDGGFDAWAEAEDRAEQRERIRAWAATPRAREVVEAMLEGRTEAQAGSALGITESRVSQILHDSRRASS